MEPIPKPTEVMSSVLRVASKLVPIMYDNNRFRVLVTLGTLNEDQTVMSYSQIARLTGISDGATLQHSLLSLMADGLIFNEKNGKYSYYGLTPLGVSLARYFLRALDTFLREKQYKTSVQRELATEEVDLTDVMKSLEKVQRSLETGVPPSFKAMPKPRVRGKA